MRLSHTLPSPPPLPDPAAIKIRPAARGGLRGAARGRPAGYTSPHTCAGPARRRTTLSAPAARKGGRKGVPGLRHPLVALTVSGASPFRAPLAVQAHRFDPSLQGGPKSPCRRPSPRSLQRLCRYRRTHRSLGPRRPKKH
eukprot:scaffold3806_cov94-Isochrysis_galbana.AAC.4